MVYKTLRKLGGFLLPLLLLTHLAVPVHGVQSLETASPGWENLPVSLPAGEEEPFDETYQLYFGLLHAHTDISDGLGTVEEAFSHASRVEGLDFFAVTDHSNSFDNADAGAIGTDGAAVSTQWAAGKAAAAAVTDETFVGIFGYEMTWRDDSGLGHISTFATPGWQSRNQPGFSSLTDYYDALTTVATSVSQFNHPGMEMGDFSYFSHWSEKYDRAVSLLEVGGERGMPHLSSYTAALERGWHVAPTVSADTHGSLWGTDTQVRTVALMENLSEESLCDAMKNRRVYATEDKDLHILYRLNGTLMGSIAEKTDRIRITVKLRDDTDEAVGRVEVMAGGKPVATGSLAENRGTLTLDAPGGYGYYWLRITQPDGDMAVTAPVWLEEKEPQPPETEPEVTRPPEEEPTLPVSVPEETSQEQLPEDLAWGVYFGLLHAHTDISDGTGTVEEAFSHASRVEGLDFFSVTDHSNSFDNAEAGAIGKDGAAVSTQWAAGKAAAEAVTEDTFVGIFGYEMTWQDDRGLGHINTFATPGWQSRSQEGFGNLEAYYEALTTVPGSVSQFNHPGEDTGTFENFAHRNKAYDDALSLLEIAGETGKADLRWYTEALDKGWHLAPTLSQNNHNGRWGDANDFRTVILAEELTRQSLFDAMLSRRVYASWDRDLSVVYRLDGQIMGSILPAGQAHSLELWLWDPTDTGDARVEVIADGGKVVGEWTAAQRGGWQKATLPGGCRYYWLRITQPDGDLAVTAPVWTETYEDIGIASFTAGDPSPRQGQAVTLELILSNEESVCAELESVEIYAGDQQIFLQQEPGTLAGGERRTFTAEYLCPQTGQTQCRALVTALVEGEKRSWEAELTLRIRSGETVAGILVDGSHSVLKPEQLESLKALAEQADMDVTVFTGAMPSGAQILILPPPEREPDDGFLEDVAAFARSGGTLILCGSGDAPEAVSHLNRILEAIGATVRLRPDMAVDDTENGGEPGLLYPTVFNWTQQLCAQAEKGQFFAHLNGCTLDVGKGTWLIRGGATTKSSLTGETAPALLARETLSGGGDVLASGSFFLETEAMPLPKTMWEMPTINQRILQELLQIREAKVTAARIREVRGGTEDELYRITGYVTAGNSQRSNAFADTVYLQDDTGGIALMPFTEPGLKPGTPMEAAGCLRVINGMPVLEPVQWRKLQQRQYLYEPAALSCRDAMDYEANGGRMVQVQAVVSAVTLTGDGNGVARFTLRDSRGDEASVLIEDHIKSGRSGKNLLASQVKVGREVRAAGIVHLDENGICVLRVRDCQEVVYVPPVTRANPFTGDRIFLPAVTAAMSATALVTLTKKRRR